MGMNPSEPHHVRGCGARHSGNGLGGSSIGERDRNVAAAEMCMPQTASPDSASLSQEADIVAALGARSLVLVGMMGAGKSTIGRRLAARLGLPFLDADIEIEAAAGMSISDMFELHGEPHFRDGEARVIARLLDSGPAGIAPGGGGLPP